MRKPNPPPPSKQQAEDKAATRIQGKARQRTARRRVEAKRQERAEQTAAATRIQGKARQREARRRVEAKRKERAEQTAAASRAEGKTRQRAPDRREERLSRTKHEDELSQAERQFRSLDKDNSGFLSGDELAALVDWVWVTFHPGGEPLGPVVHWLVAARGEEAPLFGPK